MRAALAAIPRAHILAALPFLSALFAAVMIGGLAVPLALSAPLSPIGSPPPIHMAAFIEHANVTARWRVPDYPHVEPIVYRVGKDQSRLAVEVRHDPWVVNVIPTITLTREHYERMVAPAPVETKPVPKAKGKQKRSDVAAGMQLASVTWLDHEPPYPDRAAGWPRITAEQEAAIAAEREAQSADVDTAEAWAKGEIDRYLCEVYKRLPVKKDNSGDFTWKDPAAAKRVKMDLCQYVVGGMSPDFREQLYAAGKKMDAAGIGWSMLSAFRDDYRQSIAAGLKARTGYSRHGGSRATGGYGDGQAIDIAALPGTSIRAVFGWLDKFGRTFGLHRPMPGYDAAHVQPFGAWRQIAGKLRMARTGDVAASDKPAFKVTTVKHKPRGKRARVARR